MSMNKRRGGAESESTLFSSTETQRLNMNTGMSHLNGADVKASLEKKKRVYIFD